MSVRQSLLAILVQAPCYGHQLRHEFERRTGGVWSVNVGQIYNTLERLERDGLVIRGATDDLGHVYWEITPAGASEADHWLRTPVVPSTAGRDELTIKLAVAATLPGADADGLLRAQRAVSTARRDELLVQRSARSDAAGEGLAWSFVMDSMLFAVEAELRWIDHVAARLDANPAHDVALALTAARPKRGRPARSTTTD